ncbi:MAG: DNA primase family protein [Patescibacteria group bacterium]|jgi:P4 family phage/plasmid primase-like protien
MKKVFNQDIAKELCNSDEYIQDLVYMKDYGCFYLWSGQFLDRPEGHFVKLAGDDMLRIIDSFCESRQYNQNYPYSTYTDIEKLIKMFALKRVNREDDKYIAFKDALLNVETFEIEPFDKSKICTTYFPYNIEETKEDTPVFKKFLSSSLVYEDDVHKTDEDLVKLVQEMFGMFLINNLKASTAFFLYGKSGSNGKSQLQKIIQNIFGYEHCSSLSLADLSDRFAPISLIGKRVNVAGELDEKFGNSKMFKALVSGDSIKAEHKFGNNVFFVPKTKYIFATNKTPTFDGLDGGIIRRIKIIPFFREFKPTDPDRDINLEEKLKKETAGIIGWMIEGAKRLKKQNYVFSRAISSEKMMDNFKAEMSSALMFLEDEEYKVDKNNKEYISRKDLFGRYKDWSQEVNKRPLSSHKFYNEVRSFVKELSENPRLINGSSQWCFNLYQGSNEIPFSDCEDGTEIAEGGLEQLSFK